MSDGQSSLPVEVLLSEKIVECHLSVARPVTKYLSPLLIQVLIWLNNVALKMRFDILRP